MNKSGLTKIYSGYGDIPPFAKGEFHVGCAMVIPFSCGHINILLWRIHPIILILFPSVHFSGPDSSKIYDANG